MSIMREEIQSCENRARGPNHDQEEASRELDNEQTLVRQRLGEKGGCCVL